jgi:hypothetical protein
MSRNLFTRLIAAAVLVLAPVRASFGWHGCGHMIIALIAWEDLTPKARAAVTDLLKQHARYQKDLLADLPQGATPEETDRYAFAIAATWPDLVRNPENPMHATYNHPAWHYIDIPYYRNLPPQAEAQPNGPGPHNAVEAFEKCVTELKDASVVPGERAVDICWIEHLTGDIHQPLHAVSLYSPEHPQGDKGGNDDEVLRDPPYPNSRQNLHSIWDSLPGEFHAIALDRFEAMGIRAEPSLSREHLKSMLDNHDFMGWANESHQLAIQYVYLNGNLKTAVVHHGGEEDDNVPGLPAGYLAQAETVAVQRVALAGYRLADTLNAALDPAPAH